MLDTQTHTTTTTQTHLALNSEDSWHLYLKMGCWEGNGICRCVFSSAAEYSAFLCNVFRLQSWKWKTKDTIFTQYIRTVHQCHPSEEALKILPNQQRNMCRQTLICSTSNPDKQTAAAQSSVPLLKLLRAAIPLTGSIWQQPGKVQGAKFKTTEIS